MKRLVCFFLTIAAWSTVVAVPQEQASNTTAENVYASCKGSTCVNLLTNPFVIKGIGFSASPVFQATYEVRAIPVSDQCNQESTRQITIPKGSYFRHNSELSASSDDEYLVDVYQVPVSVEWTKEKIQSTFFSDPVKLCLKGNAENLALPQNYERRGGLDSGALVVPFKYRKGGDLTGEATVGGYISYRWEKTQVLLGGGYTRVGVAKEGANDVGNEDGISVALGVTFKATKSADVSLIVGWDWMVGGAGDIWEHDGEPWVSLAIGLPFTRR